MGIMEKLGVLFGPDVDEDWGDESGGYESERTAKETTGRYGLSSDVEPIRRESARRESVREPIDWGRRKENVIAMPKASSLDKLTQKFKIVVVEPHSFDECPKLVDSLKSRKPVIINLEAIENDSARKIFDFLSGATYALNGNVQKIAQNIFVFLPENVDVATNTEPGAFKYEEEKSNPWR